MTITRTESIHIRLDKPLGKARCVQVAMREDGEVLIWRGGTDEELSMTSDEFVDLIVQGADALGSSDNTDDAEDTDLRDEKDGPG